MTHNLTDDQLFEYVGTPTEQWTSEQFERLKAVLPLDIIEQIAKEDQEWQECTNRENQDLLHQVTECRFAIMMIDSIKDSPMIGQDVRVALGTAITMLNPTRLIDQVKANVRTASQSFRQRILNAVLLFHDEAGTLQ